MDFLWLIPALPLAGFLVLSLNTRRLPRKAAGILGTGVVGASFLLALAAGAAFLKNPEPFTQTLWTWMSAGNFSTGVTLRWDALSMVMTLVVTFIGFLIHIYSMEYMKGDHSLPRFFACLNLFVSAMLILVLADNLPLLYLGWEGVGLCSYLLIGFWYKDPANGRAARKAFVVTRVGDTALGLGVFLLFTRLGTLDIQELVARATEQWPAGSSVALVAAALVLGGAIGKSAQMPLQVWLPDAMAGPTPVSALLHSATMVTAGVYLIARLHGLFLLAPAVMCATAAIGAATILLAGCSALAQTDIKRVLAYSSISQIGYMFLALGVGAWSAAVFHFFTHAFFKALLFMAAGAVIHALHNEQDMFKMGGLRKAMPGVFWPFAAGAASLAALPLVTAGFYSKDMILWEVWSSGGHWLWASGAAGAFLTSLYSFRMVFLTFFGPSKTSVSHKPGPLMTAPLALLGALALLVGFLETPRSLGHVTVFSGFLGGALKPAAEFSSSVGLEVFLQLMVTALGLAGLFAAYLFYLRRPDLTARWAAAAWCVRLRNFWLAGWGFDALYDKFFVKPFFLVAGACRHELFDFFYDGLANFNRRCHAVLSVTQNGFVRWYALTLGVGAVVILGLLVVR